MSGSYHCKMLYESQLSRSIMLAKSASLLQTDIVNQATTGGLPTVGTLISPSTIKSGIMNVNSGWKSESMLNSLVCFIQNKSPILAQITDVMTSNPFMDPESNLGRGNMSYIASHGRIPHTEHSDTRFAELEFICQLSVNQSRSKLRNSPDIGLTVVNAEKQILETFFPFHYPEHLGLGKYLGTELVLPLDVESITTVHCGIFGITGWGKSVLQAYLAALLVRAGNKVLIFDHSGDYASPGSPVRMIFEKLVKDFKVHKANEIRADHDLFAIKIKDTDIWEKMFGTTAAKANQIAEDIISSILDKYPDDTNLATLDGSKIIEILEEAIPLIFGNRTVTAKLDLLRARKILIVDWFDKNITVLLKRPITFKDVIDNSLLRNSAVVIDLTGEDMTLSEKCLYLHKIGRLMYERAKHVYEKEAKRKLGVVTIVDEAHNYVPERSIEDGGSWQKRSKSLLTTLAKEGRKYGIGVCLADQRITAVDKDAIDFQTYFLGKLQMKGDQDHVKSMFGDSALTAMSVLRKYQFIVVGGANPLEDVAAPIQVFDPNKDLQFVDEMHPQIRRT